MCKTGLADRPSKVIDWLIKEAKAAIDALDRSPLMISTVQDQSPNLKIHQKSDYFNKETVNNEQISSLSLFSMENGATPSPSTKFQVQNKRKLRLLEILQLQWEA
ncbi:transcription factor TCP3-like [Forsythia ovata]|uniref:Transcription factor TCP3-like n=1 Tax=Forsythia ovata TaxID=205694 RepID=A0ABD1S1I4_9LAMI